MDSEDVDSIQNENLEDYLNLNLKLLSCIGFDLHPSVDSTTHPNRFLRKIPAMLEITLELYGVFSQMIFISEAIGNDDFLFAAQVITQLFSNVLCMSKGIMLVTCIAKLDRLLRELAVVWRKHVPRHENRDEIRRKARNTLLFCKIFATVTFGAVFGFSLPALRNLVLMYTHRKDANYTRDYSVGIFFMKYPFAVDNPLTYCLILIEEEMALIGVALFWICGDTFFAQLTTHASLQFEMLRYDINSLLKKETSDAILRKNFAMLISRHQVLLRICEGIEKIYSPVVLVTVLISSVSICFNMFELSETINSGHFADASIPGFILINVFLQIVFYCVFAEALTEQVSTIGEAIYNSNWMDQNYKFRKYIQMLIVKSQKPFYCTAYGFFPIGHVQLTVILKAAFSYYMMLTATT